MLDEEVAFPTLDDSEMAAIEALGSRRSISVGEYLYREGDARYDFYVAKTPTSCFWWRWLRSWWR